MCGRLNVIDNPDFVELCEGLGIILYQDGNNLITGRFIGAASYISIIREVNGIRQMDKARWWLLLEATESGFKPSKYTSFNTRYDKLNTPSSAGYKAFRQSRCIIPAIGFGETQGKGKDARYTDFLAEDGAIAFGGLCREWVHKETGEVHLSCSVITLPPHDKIKPYHTKASPLMLRQGYDSMNMWLDSSLTDTRMLDPLLLPHIPINLLAQGIDKPSSYQPIDKPVLLQAD